MDPFFKAISYLNGQPNNKAFGIGTDAMAFAYGFIMKSLSDDATAYSKVIDHKTAHDVWGTLAKEYGQSRNAILHVLEARL